MKKYLKLLSIFLIGVISLGISITKVNADVDDTFNVDGINYKVTSENPNTVKTYENAMYGGETLNIPSTVSYNGKAYTVTIISGMDFMGATSTSLIIPDSITEIGDCSFALSKFTSITIPNRITTLYGLTFNGIPAGGTVYVSGGTSDAFNAILLGGGLPASWTIVDLEVSSIAVKTNPTTNYIANDNFDPAGLVITATYNNGTTKDIEYNDTTKNDFSFSKSSLSESDNKVVITYEGKSTDISVTVKPRVYDFQINDEKTYTEDSNGTILFEINADYNKFEDGGKVYVDNVLLSSSDYTSKSGSTIITLAKEYIASLKEGAHILKVEFNDGGEATTNFVVTKENSEIEKSEEISTENTTETNNLEETNLNDVTSENASQNPKTGDNIIVYISLLIVGIIGTIISGISVKKIFN